MERVRKTFFDPLATSKARIREILRSLPEGSAHPFSPERILLHQTRNTINNIDISSHEESYFYNAVDLGEMGETLLRRMGGFKSQLGMPNQPIFDEVGKLLTQDQMFSRTSKFSRPRQAPSKSLSRKAKSPSSLCRRDILPTTTSV